MMFLNHARGLLDCLKALALAALLFFLCRVDYHAYEVPDSPTIYPAPFPSADGPAEDATVLHKRVEHAGSKSSGKRH